MCGIVGIYSHEPVAFELYESLIHLQHRGQDAAGILTCDQRFYTKHGLGLVQEIFTPENISSLKGNIGIGHVRYPTAGGYSEADVQPLWIGSPRGIALAHNGNIANYPELADEIRLKQHRHLNSSLDSEAVLLMLADQLSNAPYGNEEEEIFFESLCQGVNRIFQRMEGAYSIVSVIIGKGLVAFRDPHGIRPLVWGTRENLDGTIDTIFASETTPFYALGFKPQGDIQPGEVAYVDLSGKLHRRIVKNAEFRPCVFEYVYFARPDATLNNVSVYRARLRMGQNLAQQWKTKYPDLIPDVVIPAPSTANTAALSFAHELGVRYSEGLYKNPFIGRTFIMPNQKTRSRSIRYKLTPQRTEIQNKVVMIVDDSIVRGTTSREIVKMVREFGAKKIYFASTSPALKNPCFSGIDIPSRKELIAANQTEDEIAAYLGVDALMYQSRENLIEAVTRRGQHQIKKPCMACMDGDYFCNKITLARMQQLEQQREAGRHSPLEKNKEDFVE
ncbi:amidophosphoribosyltransferase [Legionella micdadei]|uniref:Amidophosphoribosyltransferase n=1 Tax=Legionella micdadei TaxID=451 RepID=A0A098GDB0_LEGMI|nr:amidophosphoribosyltransferase [Legionella micdadei]ARG98369.1 amidophosphoribosyltransferase [Legionella micdadei]KTD27302.1 amidophosphoribosyltransferase [Legionella micdadei]NSL18686.1 amidophosphoribosyltransferase [Legionella micdadei]CEG59957.1 Amidophosphoribosyltransferase [Legionella micdadei]SCY60240.1 amidophosphoribosyltransferase [Legionella micdadei]